MAGISFWWNQVDLASPFLAFCLLARGEVEGLKVTLHLCMTSQTLKLKEMSLSDLYTTQPQAFSQNVTKQTERLGFNRWGDFSKFSQPFSSFTWDLSPRASREV